MKAAWSVSTKNFVLALLMAAAGMAGLCSCAKQEPVSHFLISPEGGQTECSVADADKLRAVLDSVAAHYGMPKVKSGQAGIIRYYQAVEGYEIGFFAKRDRGYLRVYATPMTPSVLNRESYQLFRQKIADVLSQTFPGRVSLAK